MSRTSHRRRIVTNEANSNERKFMINPGLQVALTDIIILILILLVFGKLSTRRKKVRRRKRPIRRRMSEYYSSEADQSAVSSNTQKFSGVLPILYLLILFKLLNKNDEDELGRENPQPKQNHDKYCKADASDNSLDSSIIPVPIILESEKGARNEIEKDAHESKKNPNKYNKVDVSDNSLDSSIIPVPIILESEKGARNEIEKDALDPKKNPNKYNKVDVSDSSLDSSILPVPIILGSEESSESVRSDARIPEGIDQEVTIPTSSDSLNTDNLEPEDTDSKSWTRKTDPLNNVNLGPSTTPALFSGKESEPPALHDVPQNQEAQVSTTPTSKSDTRPRRNNILTDSMASTIKNEYKGTTVSAMLPNSMLVSGEVVFNYDGVVALKQDDKTIFINEKDIITFY
jgi:hypothetical protein